MLKLFSTLLVESKDNFKFFPNIHGAWVNLIWNKTTGIFIRTRVKIYFGYKHLHSSIYIVYHTFNHIWSSVTGIVLKKSLYLFCTQQSPQHYGQTTNLSFCLILAMPSPWACLEFPNFVKSVLHHHNTSVRTVPSLGAEEAQEADGPAPPAWP